MKKSFLNSHFIILLSLFVSLAGCSSLPSHPTVAAEPEDPNQWLEEIESANSLAWVKIQNDHSLALLKADPSFAVTEKEIRRIVLAKDRIPYPKPMGRWVYNLWQDESSVHGLWRRMSLHDYQKKSSKWETVLDLDKLSKAESENWVWKGSQCLPPAFDRCLLQLSRGGKDAQVTREFDTASKTFVRDGFVLPEARSSVRWMDRDTLLVGTDWGPGTLAATGFPRIIKTWRRGTPLSDAEFLFEGAPEDIITSPFVAWSPDRKLVGVISTKTYFSSSLRIMDENKKLTQISLPADFRKLELFKDQLLVILSSDWTVDGKTFTSGSLVSLDANDLQHLKVLEIWKPEERTALTFVEPTLDTVFVGTMDNVSGEVRRAILKDGKWELTKLDLPGKGSISYIESSSFSRDFFLDYESFLTPPTLFYVTGSSKPKALRQLPPRFDTKDLVVEQLHVPSADGTLIPYFVVRKKSIPYDGSNPTLMYGYGGFNISKEPFYSGSVGKVWLGRGGVYVLANIRGGGEFGPQWHKAALRENRHKAFEDFIAIGEDLVKRKITSPAHLGIMGGSNGGLLVGAAMTLRPDLFKAVVCQVPLLDMMRFHKLSAGKLWVDEYGNPDDPKMAPVLRAYSPYQNVRANTQYPRPFLLTSTKDDRVHPGHARKMVAKFIADGYPILYYENTNGGHSAEANLEERILRSSLEYTYLVQELMVR